jgi:hypothetical protein
MPLGIWGNTVAQQIIVGRVSILVSKKIGKSEVLFDVGK